MSSTIYICKIFTPEFKAKLEQQILGDIEEKQKTEGKVNANGISLESFQAIRIRMNYNFMWNNPKAFKDSPEVEEYYRSVGLWEPECTEIQLEAAESGFQSRPRVMWNGEVTKIDEIDEIFSYREKKLEGVVA